MEVDIKSREDLVKLKGWMVVDISVVTDKQPHFFRVRLSHAVAEKDINLDFSPIVSINVMGANITAIPDVRFSVCDAEDK